ncbi:hypothetical protein NZK35_32020 [Stieleria sp. ICT_E10.1]|uniref:hypothetical protein n=1 Tax=Stieleria sedimenti TaxID=2976331 RepID=UPI00218006D5|nr:hypothetical protein [Stieleria sedimenti]MCS7471306.1 hypothetical protein [Stieleria sedimenti]
MRTLALLATVFLIPFGVLSYLGQYDTNRQSRVCEALVEDWLTAEKAGRDTQPFWEKTRDPLHFRSLTEWQIQESSASHVNLLIHRLDRLGRPTPPDHYRVTIGSDYDRETNQLIPKIRMAENLSDPLGYYSRLAVDHVEDWLDEQRSGGDGTDYWAPHTRPSRLYSIAEWSVVNEPENRSDTSVHVLVNSATKGGHPIRKTWRIEVTHGGFGYNDYEPKITNVIDLSDSITPITL